MVDRIEQLLRRYFAVAFLAFTIGAGLGAATYKVADDYAANRIEDRQLTCENTAATRELKARIEAMENCDRRQY